MNAMENILKLWGETRSADKDITEAYTLKQIEKIAGIFSAGTFYYYVFNHFDQKINYVHPNVEKVLGIAPELFSLERYLECIHPEDASSMRLKEKVAMQFLLKEIPPEKIPYYKVSYFNRVKTAQGDYKTILHQAVPLTVSSQSKIGYMLTVHTDLSYLPTSFDHRISVISLNGDYSWYRLDPEIPDFSTEDYALLLSDRERQVLAMISEGKKSTEIASELDLSVATVSTHRKNILSKVRCKNTTELIAKCIKSGLI